MTSNHEKLSTPDFSKLPQFMAIFKNELPVLEKWIQNSDNDINCPEPWNKTTLLMQSSYNGNYNITQFLISKKAQINQTDKHNQTALMYACLSGKANIVKLLLDRNADTSIISENNYTAMRIAIQYQKTGVIEVLKHYALQESLQRYSLSSKRQKKSSIVFSKETCSYLNDQYDIIEYSEIKNMTELLCQDDQEFKLKLTKLFKIESKIFQENYQIYKKELIHPHRTELKFFGHTGETINKIINSGSFELSNEIGPGILGQFGPGVYFSTESTKAAQFTHGDNYLLLCEVAIGKYWTVFCPMHHLTLEEVKRLNYDSVYGLRKSIENYGGCDFDEFIIYHPHQAIPLYLIEFERVDLN